MIEKLKQIEKNKGDSKVNILIGKKGIETKVYLENKGLLDKNKFFDDNYSSLSEEDKQLLENKRNELTQKGYGLNFKKEKYNLLEMFKGTGSVGKVFKDFNIISLDLDPIYTPTIETDILDWNYQKFFKESKFKPDFIWASPPCNTFSPLAYPLKERDTKTAEPKSELPIVTGKQIGRAHV